MPSYDERVDVYAPSRSHFLLPSPSPLRTAVIKNRRSSTSLRVPSNLVSEEESANGRHSLAHELAVALMPEPSPGSKLLAEEFGIEYDEGAEGIDSESVVHHGMNGDAAVDMGSSFADELGTLSPTFHADHHLPDVREPVLDPPPFAAPPASPQKRDPMEILALELDSTDKFLSHLRHLDIDSAGASVAQPALEKIASDVIRHINDTTRDREGQVRALLEYEREFRKIAAEMGGNEVLGQLEELPPPQVDLAERPPAFEPVKQDSRKLESVAEEDQSGFSNDWETDPDLLHLEDEDEITHSPIQSPIKDSFPLPPPVDGPPTVSRSIPQLIHLRSLTTSLVSSLSTISDQAQVTGVATTEAGRKIRALKNKLGGWRMDWDSAERSRLRIERWEAGLADDELPNDLRISGFASNMRRTDGRKLVKEHLKAFEQALADAASKTKAIMAS